jgi:hypothetical protein
MTILVAPTGSDRGRLTRAWQIPPRDVRVHRLRAEISSLSLTLARPLLLALLEGRGRLGVVPGRVLLEGDEIVPNESTQSASVPENARNELKSLQSDLKRRFESLRKDLQSKDKKQTSSSAQS